MKSINTAPFHLAQTALTGLIVVLSAALLGTSAHTLRVFHAQQPTNPWWMPLWPQHFDTHGTKALIASSTVTLVLSAVHLVICVLRKVNLSQKYTLAALIALGTTLPSLLLTLMTTIWAHMLNHNTPETDTIQTWSCKYQNSRPLAQSTATPSELGNAGFKSICQESRFALHGTPVVFVLLGLSMGLAVATWVGDKRAARQQAKDGMELGVVQEYPKHEERL